MSGGYYGPPGYMQYRDLAYQAGAAQARKPNFDLIDKVWNGGDNMMARRQQAQMQSQQQQAEDQRHQQFEKEQQDRQFSQQRSQTLLEGNDQGSRLTRAQAAYAAEMQRAQAQIDASQRRADDGISAANKRADSTLDQRKTEQEQRQKDFEAQQGRIKDQADDAARQRAAIWGSTTAGQDATKEGVKRVVSGLGPMGELAGQAFSGEGGPLETSSDQKNRIADQRVSEAQSQQQRIKDESDRRAGEFQQNQTRMTSDFKAQQDRLRQDRETSEYDKLAGGVNGMMLKAKGKQAGMSDADVDTWAKNEAHRRAYTPDQQPEPFGNQQQPQQTQPGFWDRFKGWMRSSTPPTSVSPINSLSENF